MYIFKNKKIGGSVDPHKDSSYLITNPLSCMGVWFSLDEATKENGCMWGVPGSHSLSPQDYFRVRKTSDGVLETYKDIDSAIPDYSIEGAIPLEVPPGSIVLLNGQFLHYSEPNRSEKQRHAYTLHIVERGKGTKFCDDNWIQRHDKERCEGVEFRDLEL